jgi:hypothetical protein
MNHKTRATHPPPGTLTQAPRCGNCVPPGRNLQKAPEMIKTDDPDGYICGKCGKILLWYQLQDGGRTLDIPQ